MKEQHVLQKIAKEVLRGVLGFFCSRVCLMGYYPFVPAFFAANCLIPGYSVLLYIGMIAGILYSMTLTFVVKYIFLLAVIAISIRFYFWANGRCKGSTAGILAGCVTVILNLSGSVFAGNDKNELVLGISEGLVVIGLTIAFHYLIAMLSEIRGSFFRGKKDGEIQIMESKAADGKVAAFANAVDGLAVAFAGMNREKETAKTENLGALEQELVGTLCASCDGCAICWKENPVSISAKMKDMLQAVIEHQSKENIIKKAYVAECPRYPNMVEEAIHAFGRMELNQAWYKRLLENRRIIAGQLDAMAELLCDWTKKDNSLDEKMRLTIAKISYEAKEYGLLAEDVHIFQNEEKRKYVVADVRSKWGGGIPSKNYVKALEKALKLPMRLQREAKSILTQEPVTLIAYEDTRYYVMSGVATKKKNGSSISGDSFSFFELDNGKHYICLSDGMGSGGQASQESELVVDLLQKFVEAGFPKETAIKMMNSAMVLQGEDNSFSTFDLAEINLYTGDLELTKIGAAATFIKSKGRVECVMSDTLPTGVDICPQEETTQMKLSEGDFLVMVTDGVLEYLHVKKPEAKMKDFILDIQTDHAGAFAKELLDKILLYTGNYAMDDMTILVIGMWEK